MSEDQRKVLTVALGAGSVAIVVAGLAIALAGSGFGWLIVAFGVLDLAALPLILRRVGGRRGPSADSPVEPPGEEAMPSAPPDPAHNPYARED